MIAKRIENAVILIDNSNVKIIIPYTPSYENLEYKKKYNLFEKISELGLEWAQTGGKNLYIYNGCILLGKYKTGYVSLADFNIDKPNKMYMKPKHKK